MEPDPPVNVHALYPDHIVPLDCVYEGFEGGIHVWTVTTPLTEKPMAVYIDQLPGHTSVRLPTTWAADE